MWVQVQAVWVWGWLGKVWGRGSGLEWDSRFNPTTLQPVLVPLLMYFSTVFLYFATVFPCISQCILQLYLCILQLYLCISQLYFVYSIPTTMPCCNQFLCPAQFSLGPIICRGGRGGRWSLDRENAKSFHFLFFDQIFFGINAMFPVLQQEGGRWSLDRENAFRLFSMKYLKSMFPSFSMKHRFQGTFYCATSSKRCFCT